MDFYGCTRLSETQKVHADKYRNIRFFVQANSAGASSPDFDVGHFGKTVRLRDPRVAPNAIYFVAVGREPSGFALVIVQQNRAACADTAKNTKVDGIDLAPAAHGPSFSQKTQQKSMRNVRMQISSNGQNSAPTDAKRD